MYHFLTKGIGLCGEKKMCKISLEHFVISESKGKGNITEDISDSENKLKSPLLAKCGTI